MSQSFTRLSVSTSLDHNLTLGGIYDHNAKRINFVNKNQIRERKISMEQSRKNTIRHKEMLFSKVWNRIRSADK